MTTGSTSCFFLYSAAQKNKGVDRTNVPCRPLPLRIRHTVAHDGRNSFLDARPDGVTHSLRARMWATWACTTAMWARRGASWARPRWACCSWATWASTTVTWARTGATWASTWKVDLRRREDASGRVAGTRSPRRVCAWWQRCQGGGERVDRCRARRAHTPFWLVAQAPKKKQNKKQCKKPQLT